MNILTEQELQAHERALEDYPDAMPTYETLSRYIFSIRELLGENMRLRREISTYKAWSPNAWENAQELERLRNEVGERPKATETTESPSAAEAG